MNTIKRYYLRVVRTLTTLLHIVKGTKRTNCIYSKNGSLCCNKKFNKWIFRYCGEYYNDYKCPYKVIIKKK